MSTDLCIVSMMKLLKFWFYLLSGTTRNSKSDKMTVEATGKKLESAVVQ